MRRRASTPAKPGPRRQGDQALDVWAWPGAPSRREEAKLQSSAVPTKGSRPDIQRAFKLAEHYARYNEWVQLTVGLLRDFGMHGWDLKEVEPDTGRNKSKNLKRWLKDHRSTLFDLHRGLWREFLVSSNVVVATLPRTGAADPRPMILPPADCEYGNRLGIETLKFLHGLNATEIENLPPALREHCRTGCMELHKIPGAKFRALTEARYGEGFSPPSMMSIFHGCETAEALAAADGSLAEAARRVVILHKLGYEIRTGPNAGMPTHHAKGDRLRSCRTQFQSKVGVVEAADNFDHEISVFALDPKYFDERRLNSVERRLFLWSAPIGQMLTTRGGIAPFLMTMLRVRVEALREAIGGLFEHVVNDHMQPPVELQVRYDRRILRDDRLAAELMKFSLTNGLSSQRTARTDVGLDDEAERQIKDDESKQPLHQRLPVFDPAHGQMPGGGSAARGGRPRKDGAPADT